MTPTAMDVVQMSDNKKTGPCPVFLLSYSAVAAAPS